MFSGAGTVEVRGCQTVGPRGRLPVYVYVCMHVDVFVLNKQTNYHVRAELVHR